MFVKHVGIAASFYLAGCTTSIPPLKAAEPISSATSGTPIWTLVDGLPNSNVKIFKDQRTQCEYLVGSSDTKTGFAIEPVLYSCNQDKRP